MMMMKYEKPAISKAAIVIFIQEVLSIKYE